MSELDEILDLVGKSVVLEGSTIRIQNDAKFRNLIGNLVQASALRTGPDRDWARHIIRSAAISYGILPSSIQELYAARGRGQVPPTFTVPAMNLRVLSFDAARAVFRVAKRMNAGAFIFEIARSEIGYTGQRPAEYTTNILAAAIAEEWSGPVFLQGDHFQFSARNYNSDPQAEMGAVKKLTAEAIAAGFYNIDIDASTLVDIKKQSIAEQQRTNSHLTGEMVLFIREHEPAGITISVGGEIGEVGGHNSTADELRAYMDGLNASLKDRMPGKPGLSKISIQTGTSHGGTVLPNGALARVNIDFNILRELSQLARMEYGLGGAVQHGASTLPEDAFHDFVVHEAVEVHLATNFMTIFYNNSPDDLRQEMYAWLDQNAAAERKPGMTAEQFYYKARKNAIGPFKERLYKLPESTRAKIGAAWETQFGMLFERLGMQDTRQYVTEFVNPVPVASELMTQKGQETAGAMADDLQD